MHAQMIQCSYERVKTDSASRTPHRPAAGGFAPPHLSALPPPDKSFL